jgi:hypothetical protein
MIKDQDNTRNEHQHTQLLFSMKDKPRKITSVIKQSANINVINKQIQLSTTKQPINISVIDVSLKDIWKSLLKSK